MDGFLSVSGTGLRSGNTFYAVDKGFPAGLTAEQKKAALEGLNTSGTQVLRSQSTTAANRAYNRTSKKSKQSELGSALTQGQSAAKTMEKSKSKSVLIEHDTSYYRNLVKEKDDGEKETSDQNKATNMSSEKQPQPHSMPVPKREEQKRGSSRDEQQSHDAMISYSHQDMELMRSLRQALNSLGVSTWVDEEGLAAGVDFLSKIGKAIVDTRVFIQILTPNSVTSKYCIDELSLAYVSKKPIFIVSTKSKSELFELMDFGQKLTLSPIQFMDVADQRLFATVTKSLAKQVKDTISLKNSDDVPQVQTVRSRNDAMPGEFWRKNFETQNDPIPWPTFWEAIERQFGDDLKTIASDDKDFKFIKDLIIHELTEASTIDNLIEVSNEAILEESFLVNLNEFTRFCTKQQTTGEGKGVTSVVSTVWESIERQALEHYAIREVFSLQSSVRLDAIENLGKFSGPTVVEALLDLLRDEDPNVRAVAAISLAKSSLTGDKRAAMRVSRLLHDSDRLVRESACLALGHMKAIDQVGSLVNLWRNDVISVVRDAAQLALELIGGDEANEAIHMTKILAAEIKSIIST